MENANNMTFTEEEMQTILEERRKYYRDYYRKNPEKRKIWNARFYLNRKKKNDANSLSADSSV